MWGSLELRAQRLGALVTRKSSKMAKVFGSSLPKKTQREEVPTAEKLEGNQEGGAGPDDTGGWS